jgi:membrane protease YdiL (CAAX protease family)
VDLGTVRAWFVERRWAVALASGLLLIAVKRAVQYGEGPPDPLVVNLGLYLVVPLVLAALLAHRPRGVGLAVPVGRDRWTIMGILLAAAVARALAGTLFPAMMDYYPQPIWGEVTSDLGSFVPYELGIAVIMLCVETLFRGWLVLATAERLGRWSIVVAAVPYALAHLGKPPEEVVFSLFAGIAFGWADWRTRSILPSFASHLTGSVLFDLLALSG